MDDNVAFNHCAHSGKNSYRVIIYTALRLAMQNIS